MLWSSQLLLQESPPLPPEAGSHQKWVQKAVAHHRTLGTNQVVFLLVSVSFQVWEEIPPHFQGHSCFKNVKGEQWRGKEVKSALEKKKKKDVLNQINSAALVGGGKKSALRWCSISH